MQKPSKRLFLIFLFLYLVVVLFLYLRIFGPIRTTETLSAEDNLIAFHAVTFPSPFSRQNGLFLLNVNSKRMVRWEPPHSEIGAAGIAWLNSQQQLLFEGVLNGRYGLYTISVDGVIKELSIFAPGEASGLNPAFSQDERHLAFARDGNIYIYDLQTTEIHQITYGNSQDVQPRWSPDSQALIFLSAVTPSAWLYNIYRINLSGSDPFPLTAELEGRSFNAQWSPDGTMIAFVNITARDQPASLWVMNQDGSNARVIVPPYVNHEWGRGVGDFAWSPDSRQIVFVSDRNGFCYIPVGESLDCTESLYLINIDGTGLKRLTYRWQIATSLTWIR